MNNPFTALTPQQLRQAAGLRERIDNLEKQLAAILDIRGPDSAGAVREPKRRYGSAARAKMAAAAKRRWARARAGGKTAEAAPKATKQRQRKLTAAARAEISKRMKARWAKVKAAGKTSL